MKKIIILIACLITFGNALEPTHRFDGRWYYCVEEPVTFKPEYKDTTWVENADNRYCIATYDFDIDGTLTLTEKCDYFGWNDCRKWFFENDKLIRYRYGSISIYYEYIDDYHVLGVEYNDGKLTLVYMITLNKKFERVKTKYSDNSIIYEKWFHKNNKNYSCRVDKNGNPEFY